LHFLLLSESSETSFTPHLTHSDLNDPLSDKRWLKLVEECVGLFDDLDRHFASLDPARQDLAEHLLLQLQEILERSDVEIIAGDTIFERRLHQSEQADIGAVSGVCIVETLSPGFIVGRRVLRRARVRVASTLS
jgi:molecular chaperone GrpE (heat shock protein)